MWEYIKQIRLQPTSDNMNKSNSNLYLITDKWFKFLQWSALVSVLKSAADNNQSILLNILYLALYSLLLFWTFSSVVGATLFRIDFPIQKRKWAKWTFMALIFAMIMATSFGIQYVIDNLLRDIVSINWKGGGETKTSCQVP